MVTKEKFNSFPLNKRYLIAASDFVRAASLLKEGHKDLADNYIDIGFGFMNYLFQDDPSLISKFPSKEKCKEFVNNDNYMELYEIYLELMDMGGIPKAKVREAEKQSF